ncbi:uncharacterized protein LOC126971156 [Leptidea sinapis]|uniref:uncharacterized protein LOC126971156 n=1 Tax=Leptidea sinapis TaxID=189913 RepID=UPI002135F5E3|nr:uncharacterized protein LOC126971156 [Leptidea sinapis]XP_050673265.1 uncharacterized protein LOC126971156 [Leptidea sinapis]XP_050673266.1 uncharacterized protein LOC126971156 [Leptidea sinapis]
MDFTSDLTSFQGSILEANSLYLYTKIKGRGGYETKIKETKQHLIKFIEDKYSNTSDKETKNIFRKFTMFLVLNADLPILEELAAIDELSSVIQTIPSLPKSLIGELLWNQYMEEFIPEIIVFTHPKLSLSLSEVLIENFQYADPRNCFKKLKILVTSCYRFIYRLPFFKDGNNFSTGALQNFHSCLKYFYEPPNRSKLEDLNKDDKYKYIGNNLYAMLLTIKDCINEYTKVQQLNPADFHEVYGLTYNEECLEKSQSELTLAMFPDNLKKIIENCNELLLGTCKELVMEVSVDIFCSWSEFEENGKSMQQRIGELCYKIHTDLCNVSTTSEHPIVNMLKQISYVPVSCEDLINNTDCDTIVSNIKNSADEREQWLKALLKKDKLCENLGIIEQIISNITVYTTDESYKLFNVCVTDIDSYPENKEEIKLLLIKAFQQCADNDKLKILEEHFTNNNFNDDLMSNQFESFSVEVFNKLTTLDNAELTNVLSLFLQCPKKVYVKFFHLAVENKGQTEIMLNILTQLKKFSDYFYTQDTEPCIIISAKEVLDEELQDERLNNYVKLICGLKSAGVIHMNKLLLLIIMPSLHSAVLNKKINSINLQCKLLKEAFTVNELLEYKVPILAMLGQVLDAVRWTITTFTSPGPPTLELLIQLIDSFISFDPVEMKEREKTWLKVKLRNISPLNMYYYRFLWNPPGDSFLEIITGVQTNINMDVDLLTTRISQLLCSTTMQEWYQIWNSLEVFKNERILDIFHDALLMIGMAEKTYRTEITWACMLYCFQNFSLIIRYTYLPSVLDDNMTLRLVNKLIMLENFAEESEIKEFCNTVRPIFAYLGERVNENDNLRSKLNETCNVNVRNKFFLDMLNKIFVKNCKV